MAAVLCASGKGRGNLNGADIITADIITADIITMVSAPFESLV